MKCTFSGDNKQHKKCVLCLVWMCCYCCCCFLHVFAFSFFFATVSMCVHKKPYFHVDMFVWPFILLWISFNFSFAGAFFKFFLNLFHKLCSVFTIRCEFRAQNNSTNNNNISEKTEWNKRQMHSQHFNRIIEEDAILANELISSYCVSFVFLLFFVSFKTRFKILQLPVHKNCQ